MVGPMFPDNGDSPLLTSREISQSSESVICRICHRYASSGILLVMTKTGKLLVSYYVKFISFIHSADQMYQN